ncbi:type II secretion system F family protein [Nocardioides sp. BP30]|uniref:type II secretion system F family protein n=1 Tax=Nocardioides sp. BP30 TaxID=3036374 RepID=UPI002469135F|nr:type II secretion system F family protein [Nocardioides sp. BP30]WGL53502.1 type II secretion system F family protein [Nocardioides sp. BP30]
MSAEVVGAALGALGGGAILLVAARIAAIRRPQFAVRVLPYLRDVGADPRAIAATTSAPALPPVVGAVFGPGLRVAADGVERVLGGAASVQRRLDRAALDRTVLDFRVEQVLWGLVCFAVAAFLGLLRGLRDPSAALPTLVVCVVGFVFGVLARDSWLSTQVRDRERRIVAEFPTVAELLALSVAAGEAPVVALDRVVRRSRGELSHELGRVLAAVRTGRPVATAFDELAARSGLPLVARFAAGIAVAVERGTPLADVLHAQAADVREAGRRELIEVAARKEVLMMIPIVFLVMPTTVVFAFFPGVLGLHLGMS